MYDAAFDILSAQDELKAAGFSEAQTRALTHTLHAVSVGRSGDLVTKADLKAEIGALETRLLKAMNDQQRWTSAVMVVMVGVLFAAIRLL